MCVVTHASVYSKLYQILIHFNLKNELSYDIGFLHVVRDPFKWVWSGMSKVIESNNLPASEKMNLVLSFMHVVRHT